MQVRAAMLTAIVLSGILFCGCGGGGTIIRSGPVPAPTTAAPTISTTAAQNGAVIVSLASSTSGATIYYTVDGSTPNASSQQYFAPFLVASNLTVKSIATASGDSASNIASR